MKWPFRCGETARRSTPACPSERRCGHRCGHARGHRDRRASARSRRSRHARRPCRPGRSRRRSPAARASGLRRSGDGRRSSWRRCWRDETCRRPRSSSRAASASFSAIVLLPEPDTPITISAHGILPASSFTKILRQRRLVHQPDGLAGGMRAVRRQVLACEHARQDRALFRARRPRTAFRGRSRAPARSASPAARTARHAPWARRPPSARSPRWRDSRETAMRYGRRARRPSARDRTAAWPDRAHRRHRTISARARSGARPASGSALSVGIGWMLAAGAQRSRKMPPRHAHVVERIAGGDKSLVADEPVHAVPRDPVCDRPRSRAIDRAASGSIRRSGRSPRGRRSRRSVPAHAPRRLSRARPDRQPRSPGDWSFEAIGLAELAPAAAVALQQFVGAAGPSLPAL